MMMEARDRRNIRKKVVISQEMQRTPETRKAKERDFPLRASRRKLPCLHLDFSLGKLT